MPAATWRGGRWYRMVAAGLPIGLFFGAAAWLDSGILLPAAIVTVLLAVPFGIWMARRMRRYWPGADALSPKDRVAVVRTARRGNVLDEPRLIQALIDYQRGLHAVVADAGDLRIRWVIWLVLGIAAAMALWDSFFGSVRDGVASIFYLSVLAFEFFWWPTLRDRVLANADRSVSRSSAGSV